MTEKKVTLYLSSSFKIGKQFDGKKLLVVDKDTVWKLRFFDKNFVKVMFLLKKIDLTKKVKLLRDSTQCENLLSILFGKNFVKVMFLLSNKFTK